MEVPLFLQGFILGFSIAAPVGPIGVLCIRRTLAQGRLVGFVSGLGAASADMFYGSIAAFGLTAISALLVSKQFILSLVGGGFLLYLGVKTFLEKPASEPAKAEATGLWGAFVSTLFLTLTNPMTIIAFVAMFAGLGLGRNTDAYVLSAIKIVLGVFLGSATWWLILSQGVGFFRDRFTPRAMLWVNRISGLIIMGFGVAALVSLLR
jgi:threonine/homoserine/homoserine lactone efflux protein